MATRSKQRTGSGAKGARAAYGGKGYPDFQDHLKSLEEAGLLTAIDHPVNKDTEMHPLVRWQFRGGIPEPDRRAFMFRNITCSRGRAYDLPVAVGALASNRAIYSIGMGVPVDQIGATWSRAIANPIAPREITTSMAMSGTAPSAPRQ